MQSKGSIRVLSIAMLVPLCVSCSGGSSEHSDGHEKGPESIYSSSACKFVNVLPKEVEVANLVAEPDRFEGKVISIAGYYYRQFEHSVLYEGQLASGDHGNSEGIWVEGLSPFSELSGKHLRVTGIFSAKEKGHLAQWPGSICVLAGAGVVVLDE